MCDRLEYTSDLAWAPSAHAADRVSWIAMVLTPSSIVHAARVIASTAAKLIAVQVAGTQEDAAARSVHVSGPASR